MTTPIDTAALRALLEKATKRPYEVDGVIIVDGIRTKASIYTVAPIDEAPETDVICTLRYEDAKAIVAALNALPALLDAYDERDMLREALNDAIDEYDETLGYKSEYLVDKHGDREEIARLREIAGWRK